MLSHRNIDKNCAVALVIMLCVTSCITALAMSGAIEGRDMVSYADRLFDQSSVHTIDIVIDDWDGFLETCTSEEYSLCTLVIDGEKFGNVAIRGKGNTSLSNVAQYGNNRYSFKIEFDHYQSGKTYYGLDKLCLNNLIQDATCMKDYLAYTLMNRMGVAAPLCSFVKINVNGEYWGLYLAVEAVEDAFIERNYGTTSGELYKPDSMSMGGGKGNGGGFRMSDFRAQFEEAEAASEGEAAVETGTSAPTMSGFSMPEGMTMPEGMSPPEGFTMPEGMTPPEGFDTNDESRPSRPNGGGMPGSGGMGSSDVKLQYTDDDPDSYSNIFGNAKTDVSEADEARLIAAIKALNEGTDIESVVNVEEVMRYFVVHSFMVNGDSYTGMMIHNYYLYENDGMLSMIPWDYNLSFGAFSMSAGIGTTGATAAVNDPIDTPVSGGDVTDRPMLAWIFASEEYTEMYHQLYSEFMADIYDSGWLSEEIERVSAMIAPYIETDPTVFYSYEEFQTAVDTLKTFCELRCQSIEGQLDGSIPATTAGQSEDSSALIDASTINTSDMGGMGGNGGSMPAMPGQSGESGFPSMPDMSDGSFPNMPNMGEGFPAMPGTETTAESVEVETVAAEEAQAESSNQRPQRPEGFDFESTATQDNTQAWIWMGVSAAVLIAALCFAMKSRLCR